MSDVFTVTVRAWRMRAKLAKPGDRPHVKKVFSILKESGRRKQGMAYDKLRSLRDTNSGKSHIYAKGADDALRMLSRYAGTPARNKARLKYGKKRKPI